MRLYHVPLRVNSSHLYSLLHIYQVLSCSKYRKRYCGWLQSCQGVVVSAQLKPMLWTNVIHHKHKSTADKALIVFFFLYFSYAMRYCFLIAPLYWDLWSGRFRAADVHLITGVIPSSFKCDNLFQSKLTSVHGVSGLYIFTKFYQGMSTMSDPVVNYSHVRGWSLPRSLSQCYQPILHHEKTQINGRKSSYC